MALLTDKPTQFTLENNTAKRVVKPNPADKIEVEIGDSLQPDFKPQFKIKRWDNEVNFSMRAEEDPTATVVVENDIIKYKATDYEVHQYEKPDVSEDGGFEFEWVLNSKPTSNVFTATIQTKGLDFFPQPALTQEEIDDGATRPDNVVGSYAVYHKTKRNNKVGDKEYKTGKAFHIYRPEAVDANGDRVWADLNIDEQTGTLTVTVDRKWLNKAAYPVVIDPTFGYNSEGSSLATSNANGDAWGHKDTAVSGTLDSISAYMSVFSNGDRTQNYQFGDATGYSGQGNIFDENQVDALTTTVALKTKTAGGETLTGTTQYVTVIGDYPSVTRFAYDSGTGTTGGFHSNGATGNWVAEDTRNYSIYATYTASSSRRVFNIS